MTSAKRAHWHHLLIFMAPAVLIYSVFMALPLLDSVRLSLYHQNTDGTLVFYGLKNFQSLFTDPYFSVPFWRALGQNFIFFAVFMLVQNPVALLIAALLSSKGLRGAAIYRTVLFAPTTLSIVIIGWIWTLMLNPLWGIINSVIQALGLGKAIPKEGWLGSPGLALIVVALVGVWQYVGLPMILFLAALLGIDDELLDQSRVDGANPRVVFWRIKFPLILPTVGIVTILTFVGNFSSFENVFVMQGSQAGPDYRTDILGTFFYRTLFGNFGQLPDPSMGPTVGSTMFLLILTVVLIYLFILQRRLIRD
jgi:raffinose/stachyose/melibiose transport system permease protein